MNLGYDNLSFRKVESPLWLVSRCHLYHLSPTVLVYSYCQFQCVDLWTCSLLLLPTPSDRNFFCVSSGWYVALASLTLESFCLSLWNAGITGVRSHLCVPDDFGIQDWVVLCHPPVCTPNKQYMWSSMGAEQGSYVLRQVVNAQPVETWPPLDLWGAK